jgi:hypothetical protein
MTATLIILAIWMAFVWFCDPDDFGGRDRSKGTTKCTICKCDQEPIS